MELGRNLPARSDPNPPSHGELLLPNGVRRVLSTPFALIGQAAGCELRLNAPTISPLHCALVRVPGGLLLRDLQSEQGTLVNGEPVSLCMLREGDVITVGPIQLSVHLPPADPQAGDLPLGAAALHEMEVIQKEKDALRIQAAAVVAQQTAVTEEELKLNQREIALQRQEEQLGAHLETKRGQLAELQQQVSDARAALRRERADFEERSKTLLADVASERKGAAATQEQAQLDRKRFVELRRRLKRRWHRHWAVQETDLRRRTDELENEWRRLANEADGIQQGKTDLADARLCFNAEVELGRRQLKDDRSELSRDQRAWAERRAREQGELRKHFVSLSWRESSLTEVERELLDEKQQWEGARAHLENEVAGLESRARNQRQKMLELTQEASRMQASVHATRDQNELRLSAITPALVPVAVPIRLDSQAGFPAPMEEAERKRLELLERLAGDLADQRLHLAEQYGWLARAEENWRQAHAEVVAELEAITYDLRERETAVVARERFLLVAEADIRQRREELAQGRCQLDAWRSRVVVREAAWESDRATVLAQTQAGEELLKRQLAALDDLRRGWKQRRRQESTECETAHKQYVEARRLYATLWEDCLRRGAALDLEKRTLAERSLALEQYRLEVIGQAPDASTAERQLERLRRRWASLFTEAERNLQRERKALEDELGRVEARSRQIEQGAADLSKREFKLTERQTEWEDQHAQVAEANDRLRNELAGLRFEREQQERQLAALRDEVERMAHTLLDEAESVALPIVQAA